MLLDEPLPFSEALDRLAQKRVLPTGLSSAELRREWPEALRRRSLFSARTTKAAILQEYQDKLAELLDGKTNIATARMELQQLIDALGYTPEHGFAGDEERDIPPAERGSLRDLGSRTRVDLVLTTNMRQMANYGFWKQGQSDFALFAYPCYELVRIYPREIPRGLRLTKGALEHVAGEDWPSRWESVGGSFYGLGRMIARKDAEIWGRLGDSSIFRDALDTWLPPFAFNSGYGWREIDRAEAIKLGVIGEHTEVEGQHHGMNEQLVAPKSLTPEMLEAAIGDLKESIEADRAIIAAEKAEIEANRPRTSTTPWTFTIPGETVAANSGYNPEQLRGYHGRWGGTLRSPDLGDGQGGGGSAKPAHPLDAKTPLNAHDAAALMRRFPTHPTTIAFSRYLNHNAITDQQGRLIDATLRRLPAFTSSQPIYRGISFDSIAERDAVADRIRSAGQIKMSGHINSASLSNIVGKSFASSKGHGVLFVALKVDKSARDIRPLSKALAHQYRHQEEIAFVRGSKFRVVKEGSTQTRAGSAPVFGLEEMP